jgi:hypothetical protein
MRTKLVAALLAAGAALAVGCSAGGDDTDGPGVAAEAAGKATKRTITMEVTGPKKASITYGLNADQSQANDAKVPWKKTMTTSEAFSIATLVAQNSGGGTISCRITVDGKVVKKNSSEGEYAMVTCTTDALM